MLFLDLNFTDKYIKNETKQKIFFYQKKAIKDKIFFKRMKAFMAEIFCYFAKSFVIIFKKKGVVVCIWTPCLLFTLMLVPFLTLEESTDVQHKNFYLEALLSVFFGLV